MGSGPPASVSDPFLVSLSAVSLPREPLCPLIQRSYVVVTYLRELFMAIMSTGPFILFYYIFLIHNRHNINRTITNSTSTDDK